MLNKIRNFSKTILAKVLLVIIIIPFVFWGMGGVFNSGNTNNIAKINNHNISTQNFVNYINNSTINPDTIRENIDKNIIEDLLNSLISENLIQMEIDEFGISISEEALVEKIKTNKNFIDEQKNFSRLKYEKFLLTKNLSAPIFEDQLKNNELRKKLFNYIGGGIKSPIFLTNKIYKNETSKIKLSYINLENNYKKKDNFSEKEIKSFVIENSESLKVEFIDFFYIKINPKNLTGEENFNETFFKKIDEIENKISNGENLGKLSKDLQIKPTEIKKYIPKNKSDSIKNKIYAKRNDQPIQLIEESDFYLLYEIKNKYKILPSLSEPEFAENVKAILYEKNKFSFNKDLLSKINDKKFNQINFDELAVNKIKLIELDSIKDNSFFTLDSVKILYTLPINSFTLLNNNKNDIFIAKIENIITKNIDENSDEFFNYNFMSNTNIKKNIYYSHDNFLNTKYKISINEKTMDRVKNFFR
jgi:peptidyl-prolyl cis-trans isomerase D